MTGPLKNNMMVTHAKPDNIAELRFAAASVRYIEFFTATIRNRNTRLAYARACYQFFHLCQENGLTLDTVRPFHVAAYIEQMPGSKPTIKEIEVTVPPGFNSARAVGL